MGLEAGESFLAAIRRASTTCSRLVFQVSASDRDLLMKNIGPCFQFSFSLNKAELTKAFDTAKKR